MNIKALFISLAGFDYHRGASPLVYIFSVIKQITLYLLGLLLLIVLITLLAFGYVPIDGGGINNPPATIAYVWGQGLLIVALPLAVFFLLLNIIKIIKEKQGRLVIFLAVMALILGALNMVIAKIDLVAIMTPWFVF